jgi:hypothetical protein
MGQFSAEKPVAPGSALSGNQHLKVTGSSPKVRQSQSSTPIDILASPVAGKPASKALCESATAPSLFSKLLADSLRLKSRK